ncbi:Protein of unknown function [Gryllus bimaculatus]|nr:Protein of unknown function [Gryllus bimaculatus]
MCLLHGHHNHQEKPNVPFHRTHPYPHSEHEEPGDALVCVWDKVLWEILGYLSCMYATALYQTPPGIHRHGTLPRNKNSSSGIWESWISLRHNRRSVVQLLQTPKRDSREAP